MLGAGGTQGQDRVQGVGSCTLGLRLRYCTSLRTDRQTNIHEYMTENITFPQLSWWAVIIVTHTALLSVPI